ncbi:MAG: DNA primase [Lachnospiraceae bacterium]|nr:DNA primase [Lachnospiraceae bacterium]
MAYYSDELIEEVRAANDIVDVISGYVHLQKKGSTYFGLCPFHNEKTPSFSVSRDKQMYYCFGCHAGGNVLTFVMEYENFSFPEAMQSLADRAHIELPKQEMSTAQKREADRREKLLEINKEAANYFYRLLKSPQGKQALDYFKNRNLTDETITHFGLGYANKYSDDLYKYLKQKGYSDDLLKDSGLVSFDEKRGGYDKFWNRAMFPIMDANSRVIGFGGRVMGDGEPKYLNSPETKIFDKSRNLYGLNFARKSRRKGFLLCEGYMDVIALHQAGFDNAVASLGTSFTSGHANLLRRYAQEVYLTFDSDDAGIRAALRAIPILKEAGISARVVDMQPHKDPDEFLGTLGPEEFEKRIEDAENSFLFEIRMLARGYDLNDPESKTAFFREVSRRLLAQFPERLERENYIEAIARLYPVGFEQLRDMVNSAGTRGGLTPQRKPVRLENSGEKKKESDADPSQSLLLTWLIEDPAVFNAVAGVIGPEDFIGELSRKAAEAVFAQHERGEPNPAQIISLFPDEEQQREVAGMFHANIPSAEDRQKREKALNETVQRVKRSSIEHRSAELDPSDIEGLQRLIEEKKQLATMQISID